MFRTFATYSLILAAGMDRSCVSCALPHGRAPLAQFLFTWLPFEKTIPFKRCSISPHFTTGEQSRRIIARALSLAFWRSRCAVHGGCLPGCGLPRVRSECAQPGLDVRQLRPAFDWLLDN
eukprot:1181538-Prorocentrum_minimum.AAC.6